MVDVDDSKQKLLEFSRDESDETLLDTEQLLRQQARMRDVSLEGDISVPGHTAVDQDEYCTLDEPVKDTILRDLKAIGKKFFHVFIPRESRTLLRDWDLWGPLILCIFVASMLQGSNDGGPEFAEIFVIYWVGASVVTLNSKLLGGAISFFQSICVLGYCVVPMALALIVCRLLLLAPPITAILVVRFLIVMAAFGWSTFASTAFLADSQPPRRKALALYPIFLFYLMIGWIIISHTRH